MKERIKKLCKDNGISLNKLEETLGFGKGYLSKLNSSTPNVSNIKKIADYFGVSVDWIMDGKENETGYYLNDETAAIAQDIFENRELRLLFDAARDAEPEDLTAVHGMLLALKRKERANID